MVTDRNISQTQDFNTNLEILDAVLQSTVALSEIENSI